MARQGSHQQVRHERCGVKITGRIGRQIRRRRHVKVLRIGRLRPYLKGCQKRWEVHERWWTGDDRDDDARLPAAGLARARVRRCPGPGAGAGTGPDPGRRRRALPLRRAVSRGSRRPAALRGAVHPRPRDRWLGRLRRCGRRRPRGRCRGCHRLHVDLRSVPMVPARRGQLLRRLLARTRVRARRRPGIAPRGRTSRHRADRIAAAARGGTAHRRRRDLVPRRSARAAEVTTGLDRSGHRRRRPRGLRGAMAADALAGSDRGGRVPRGAARGREAPRRARRNGWPATACRGGCAKQSARTVRTRSSTSSAPTRP